MVKGTSLLASKIDGGSMAQFLPVAGEKEALLSWLQDGATQPGYEDIKYIFEKRCVACHQPERLMWKRPLTSFDAEKTVTLTDRAAAAALMGRSVTMFIPVPLMKYVSGRSEIFVE